MTTIELHCLLALVIKDLNHSHSPGVHSGENVNGCLNVNGDVAVYLEKCKRQSVLGYHSQFFYCDLPGLCSVSL